MKHHTFSILTGLSAAILTLSACSTHGPAMMGNTGSYMPKPIYQDTKAGAFYLSGRVNQGYVYYKEEENQSFDLSAHVSFLWKHFYLSGGGYGYGGKYRLDVDSTSRIGLKAFGYRGLGGRFEIGGRMPLEDNFEMLFGVSEELFFQTGSYEDKTQDDFEDVLTLGIDGVSIGLNVEGRFLLSEKNCLGLRYTWDGALGGTKSGAPPGFMDLSDTHRFTLHATLNRLTVFGQLGFTNNGQTPYSLGLSMGFPFWRDKD